jgi:hypothetical protein
MMPRVISPVFSTPVSPRMIFQAKTRISSETHSGTTTSMTAMRRPRLSFWLTMKAIGKATRVAKNATATATPTVLRMRLVLVEDVSTEV